MPVNSNGLSAPATSPVTSPSFISSRDIPDKYFLIESALEQSGYAPKRVRSAPSVPMPFIYILLSGGLFLQIKIFPEGSGHEGLLELVIDEEISDVGFVQEHDFEVFCAVKVL